jgi:SAM-dependent methyltransferase
MARSAFRRVGMGHGWNAIDCGCGPIGGLAVMAEMVGLAGRVVGVDLNETAVQRARAVATALALDNAELFAGDLHELDATALGGPFDLAYTRLARSARAAGLEVVDGNGSFQTTDPQLGFELHASTLAAAKERCVMSGVASEKQIDDLVRDLRVAKGGGYEWVSSPFYFDLTLRKPTAA